MLKLYYIPQTRATRPRWLLEELGVPHELVRLPRSLDERKATDYVRIHPHARVPALVDGDMTMFESAAICLYLADKFPEKGLAPAVGTPERGPYLQWMVYSMVTLEPPIAQIYRHTSALAEAQRIPSLVEEGRATFTDVARVLETWRLLQAVEAERQQARRGERQQVRATAPITPAQRLAQLRGVAARGATVLADELCSRRLRNRREVGGLTGLVSAPYNSGTTRRDQGLVRSGLPAVRRIAVEMAWAWVRYQPTSALTRWYRERFGHGGTVTRRIGIVALARRLMIALWRYVEQGVVPEGALLKA